MLEFKIMHYTSNQYFPVFHYLVYKQRVYAIFQCNKPDDSGELSEDPTKFQPVYVLRACHIQ